MAIIIDVLLLTFMMFLLIRDTRKGLLEAVVGFSRLLISFVAAFLLAGSVSILVNRLFVYDAVYGSVHHAISSAASSVLPTIEESVSALPLLLRAFAYVSGTDLSVAIQGADSNIDAYAAALTKPLAQGLSMILAFVLLVIVTYFAIRLLIPPLSAIIKRIPLVGALNTLGGLGFGVIHAFLWGWIIALAGGVILSFLSSASGGTIISPEDTVVLSLLSKISPLRLFSLLFFR